MNKPSLILIFLIVFSSCNIFNDKEKKAIEICQKTKIQFSNGDLSGLLGLALSGLTVESTWLEYANMLAAAENDIKLDWTAVKSEEEGIYLVKFADKRGWGHCWEVTIDQKIVKYVNSSEYLSRKYGLSRFDPDNKFQIKNIKANALKLIKTKRFDSDQSNNKIAYVMEATIVNKTGRSLTRASVSGSLQVIFKDKTIEDEDDWESGFYTKVSETSPWKPNTERQFYIQTKGIDQVYLDYVPEYVFFNLNLTAEDPIGFLYNKGIEEFDLKHAWKLLSKKD